MTTVKSYKMDGLGNQFLIIDRRVDNINLSKEKIIELSKQENIGFDQLIFIEKERENNTPIIIFNSDGNEISACGNGSRCIAYLLCVEKKISRVSLITNERVLNAEIVGDLSVKINMGKPLFDWGEIPLSKSLDYKNIDIDVGGKKFNEGFALNVGNPHIIFFVKDCYAIDLRVVGPKIEVNALFPKKCNVTFAQIDNKNTITVNVWERGAGLTKACGTAACAAAVASYLKGLTLRKVNVKFKEGILSVEFDKNENIFMTGPVSKIKKIKLDF